MSVTECPECGKTTTKGLATLREWLTTTDPTTLNWPVWAWLGWAACVGILIGGLPR